MGQFPDVSDADWFAPAVERLVQPGIINGYPDGTFRPQNTASLAEMLKLLLTVMGFREPTDGTPWYSNYAHRAKQEGLIPTDSDPDYEAPVTRAELARLICRGAHLMLLQWDAVVFADVTADDKPWIDTVFDQHLMRGYYDSSIRTFRPGQAVTRAEAAVVTDRFQDYHQDRDAFRRRVAPSLVPGDQFLQPGFHVLAASADAIWAAGQDTRSLYRSADRGVGWTRVSTFPKAIQAIHFTPRGVLIVSVSDRGWDNVTDCELFRSADGGATFHPVLQVLSGYCRFWSLASDQHGFVFASEYGYKDLPNNARHIYRSTDDGETWKVVYAPPEANGYHNHKILIDKDDPNLLYQSVGDGLNSRILKSTDRGDTWSVLVEGINPTSAYQFDDHFVWGLDNTPYTGLVQIGSNGESKGEFRPPEPYHGPAYDLLHANGVLYTGLLSYWWPEHWWDGTLWISLDQGRNWDLWAVWPKVQGQGIGFYTFVRHGDDGYVHVTLPVREGNYVIPFEGTVRFPLYRP